MELVDYDMNYIFELLENPSISEERKKYFEEYLKLDVLVSISKDKNLLNLESVWQKAINKEFEQKQHTSTLASHYLRLHEYYKERGYDRFAEKLISHTKSIIDLKVIRPNMKKTKLKLEPQHNPKIGKNYQGIPPELDYNYTLKAKTDESKDK